MRLQLALDEGLTLGGPVDVRLPTADYDLAALDDARVHTPDWFVAQAFRGRVPVNPEPARVAATVVVAPRSKALAQHVIAEAVARTDGLVIVDGQRTDGIDSLWKACRKRADVQGTITKAHGRLFWMQAEPDAFADWVWEAPDVYGFTLLPGVFSADGIDPGSLALAEVMPERMEGRVIDLGAGWGYLSAVAQYRGAEFVDLVDSNADALMCAQRNVEPERAAFHWHDATTWEHRAQADFVIMNPPFHEGRKGNPDLGRAFIAAAARCLKPRGSLWMVANRHLPYEDALAAHFGKVEPVDGPPGSQGFKLFHATRPKR
ncbi:MAG: methyltransferase [Pseudomonadota bacterium]